jgi:hypothetical protein
MGTYVLSFYPPKSCFRILILYLEIYIQFLESNVWFLVIFEVLKLSSNLEYLFSFNFQLKNAATEFCFLGHLHAIKVPYSYHSNKRVGSDKRVG